MNEKVSVVVPVYNVEKYISKCIQSILDQTYTNWELILIDDGSTDRSGAICDQYQAQDARIRVFHQANRGVSVARNVGIDASMGDYLQFVDADDWIASDMMETLLQNGHGAGLIACGYTAVTEDNLGQLKMKTQTIWNGTETAFESKDIYYDFIAKIGVLWNKLIRRDVIADHRFQKGTRYGEDFLFLTFILANVKTAVIIPKPYYYYFTNRIGNVISSSPDERCLDYLRNTLIVYEETVRCGKSSCGVHRVMMTVNAIMRKMRGHEKEYIEYANACKLTMKRIGFKSRIAYYFDKRFSIKDKILLLVKYYFFNASYCIIGSR